MFSETMQVLARENYYDIVVKNQQAGVCYGKDFEWLL